MNNNIPNPYTYNLRLPEGNLSIMLDIINSKYMFGFDIDPYKMSTSTFYPLLELIDDSETINQLSFIPIEYLRFKYKTTKKFESELEEKRYLLSLIKETDNILEDTFRNIKLKLLKKDYLNAKLVPNIKYNELKNDDDIKYGINKEYDTNYSTDVWLCNRTINNIMKKFKYLNSNLKIYAYDTLLLDSYMSNELNNLKKYDNYDLYIVPIIYKSHFIICIIDINLQKTCFFDSGGYDIKMEKYNDFKYHFITSSMSYKTVSNINKKFQSSRYDYLTQLTIAIYKNFKINNFVFNNYQQQKSSTECGLFIIMFCLHYIKLYPKNSIEIKHVYNSLLTKGDYTMTYMRSLLFITKQDLIDNNLSLPEYEKSYKIYHIKNNFFKKYIANYDKLIDNFHNIIENNLSLKKEYISMNEEDNVIFKDGQVIL